MALFGGDSFANDTRRVLPATPCRQRMFDARSAGRDRDRHQGLQHRRRDGAAELGLRRAAGPTPPAPRHRPPAAEVSTVAYIVWLWLIFTHHLLGALSCCSAHSLIFKYSNFRWAAGLVPSPDTALREHTRPQPVPHLLGARRLAHTAAPRQHSARLKVDWTKNRRQ